MSRIDSLRVTHRGDDLVLGEVRETCIAIWRKKPQWPSFQIERDALRRLARQFPEQVVFVCLIEANCAPPDDAIRKASLEMVVEHSKSVRAIACVIEGTGFKASITRSVLAGMQLLLRVRVAVKFFGSAEDAAV